MKYKTWIIIIMAIALTISIVYSVVLSKKVSKNGENIVTTTSIIEMTATTATIKNTLTGTGNIVSKEKLITENTEILNNLTENKQEINTKENINEHEEEIDKIEQQKIYQITLVIENKDLEKIKIGQQVEIAVKKEEILNYLGEVKNINKDINNKSQLFIEITNPDEKIQENQQAFCTVIIEKAENIVALPIEAIQKNEQNEEYVDVVMPDGETLPINIKTGISDDYYVEITSGLNVGDRVQIIKSSTTVVNEKQTTSKK